MRSTRKTHPLACMKNTSAIGLLLVSALLVPATTNSATLSIPDTYRYTISGAWEGAWAEVVDEREWQALFLQEDLPPGCTLEMPNGAIEYSRGEVWKPYDWFRENFQTGRGDTMAAVVTNGTLAEWKNGARAKTRVTVGSGATLKCPTAPSIPPTKWLKVINSVTQKVSRFEKAPTVSLVRDEGFTITVDETHQLNESKGEKPLWKVVAGRGNVTVRDTGLITDEIKLYDPSRPGHPLILNLRADGTMWWDWKQALPGAYSTTLTVSIALK